MGRNRHNRKQTAYHLPTIHKSYDSLIFTRPKTWSDYVILNFSTGNNWIKLVSSVSGNLQTFQSFNYRILNKVVYCPGKKLILPSEHSFIADARNKLSATALPGSVSGNGRRIGNKSSSPGDFSCWRSSFEASLQYLNHSFLSDQLSWCRDGDFWPDISRQLAGPETFARQLDGHQYPFLGFGVSTGTALRLTVCYGW